jgi:hypothetical protein
MSRTYNSRDLPWRGNDLRPVGKTTVVSIVPDRWPLFDEGLSKIPAPVDIEAARLKLARKFNTRIPTRADFMYAPNRGFPSALPM